MGKLYLKFLNLILIITFISSCTSNIVLTQNLPTAVLGKPYHTEILINGGSGHISAGSFAYSITPKNSGLRLIPNFSVPTSYNQLIIQGTPNILEDIKISIQGETVTTSSWQSSEEFKKTYIIKVKAAE